MDMPNLHLFTEPQGVLLIQLVLAQIISDFLLQTDAMVKSKRWFSRSMLLHVAIVFGATALLTGLWKLALVITVFHWVIDAIQIAWERRSKIKASILFVVDQLLRLLMTIIVWAVYLDLTPALLRAARLPIADFKIGLMVLGYAVAIWPVGYLIKFATSGMAKETYTAPSTTKEETEAKESKIEHGGRRIGQFERIIILTFVLLQQYEAIGFLITGKSIIRFAQRDENLRSEYVLVGTMMSYACSILIGVLINWLLGLAA